MADVQLKQVVSCGPLPSGRPRVAQIFTRSGVAPTLLSDLPGMVIVHKPADWEVDGLVTEEGGGNHAPLSAFVQSLLPRSKYPLVWDVRHNYGFLHRLDVPSSGLVLGGTSLEGYYWLRLQLDSQRLQREYFVLCQGLAPPSLFEVVARVDVAPEPTQRRSINDSGKPARSMLSILAHIQTSSSQHSIGQTMSIVSIHILTGRRHQIRVHLRHRGHSSVTDARYTCREVLLLPRQLQGLSALELLQR
mmetsp:Transcript_36270/g.92374  ORF Transcript_36270/g.92374 Transcript_36270/m.92374 type:complete len:247 (-) Transcript_36270:86-826(-)